MTVDPASFALGIVATYAFSTALVVVLCVLESRQAKKQRDRDLDNLLADVGVACIERPTNVRSN